MRRIWRHDRQLRRECTRGEQRLWRFLRDGQLSGLRFRRQHPIAGYVADFACVEAGVVVELEAGEPLPHRDYDLRRAEILAAAGYRILRFRTEDALSRTSEVLSEISRELSGRRLRVADAGPAPIRAVRVLPGPGHRR